MKRTLFFFLISLLLAGPGQAAGAAFLRGKIVDPEGNPVAGAEVYVYDSSQVKRPADFVSGKTLTDGLYSLALPPGAYWAVALARQADVRFGPLAPGDRHSGEPVKVVIREEGEVQADFTIFDLREAARRNRKKGEDLVRVLGRIVDPQGEPVAMAYAAGDAQQAPGAVPAYVSAWTGADGAFTLYLPPGRYFLGPLNEFPPAPSASLGPALELTEDVSGIELVLGLAKK